MNKVLESKALKLLIEHSDEGIHIVDHEGVTVAYNKTMERIEGIVPSEIIGKNLRDTFPFLSENNSTLLQALEYGNVVEHLKQNYTNYKGQKISTINHTYPIEFEGEILGAIELSKPLTDVEPLKPLGTSDTQQTKVNTYRFSDIIGDNALFKKAVDMAKKSAKTSATVFIYGKTGTGKELFAQSIHNHSVHRQGPFIAINCSALPETLLDSLLFGTVKGSFTDAEETKGLFEQAHKGTLFLDEISSMSLHLQAKLLRVLQESVIRKVGGNRDITIDVRIIAATNEDPFEQIKKGELRQDLYYRLNVIHIDIPSLDERQSDIIPLAEHFLKKYATRLQKEVKTLSDDLKDVLTEKRYLGNVRELEHFIESAVSMLDDHRKTLRVEDLPDHFFVEVQSHLINLYDEPMNLDHYLAEIEKNLIRKAFIRAGKNVTLAAAKLGIPRQNLQYKLKKYELK